MDKCKISNNCRECGQTLTATTVYPCDAFRESWFWKKVYQFVVEVVLADGDESCKISYCPFCGERLK